LSKNERVTENLVREALRGLGYYKPAAGLCVEEQSSTIKAINSALKTAGKAGKGGRGSPEFIITDPSTPDFAMVIECKANASFHESPKRDKPVDYSVDGALHYAKYLSKDYNVLALAVSGTNKAGLRLGTFLHAKGATEATELKTRGGFEIQEFLSWPDYLSHATWDPKVLKIREIDLLAFSRDIHDFMRDHAKLTEGDKPLVVSGTLIALQNTAFSKSFDAYKPSDLQVEWFKVIQSELEKADIPKAKKQQISQPYSNIAVLPELGKGSEKFPRGVLYELIKELNEKVAPFVSVYHDYDVVGQFYGEFLKYSGGDKKGLGIVLTPRHITDLFTRLANITAKNKVLDTCAGTGGFLISAMHRMVQQAKSEAEVQKIKSSGLVGIESLINMYALAASNMILRGDGKANLYQGSCFDPDISKAVKAHKCDVVFLNPPYSQGSDDLHELKFVQQALDLVEPGSTCIAIVPMSCAISRHPLRAELMKQHQLEAVMSMPDDLFYPVGTVTCIMVWKAKVPHVEANKKTWFGYWKNDGFTKVKHRGRVDTSATWSQISDRWVESFRNREVHEGESVLKMVGPDDEWCAEAYIETDYSTFDSEYITSSVRNFLAWQIQKPLPNKVPDLTPNIDGWKLFFLDELFELKKGKRLTKAQMTEGEVPFVSSTDSNNGISAYVGQKAIHEGNTLTVNYDGSVAEAFYQPSPFWALDAVNVLYPKFEMNQYSGLFIAGVIRREKYRFNYGRKWHLERMAASRIKLPVKSDGTLDLDFMETYIRSLPGGELL